jgi:hypothetical protein
MGKRRGIDLMPLPGLNRSGNCQSCDGNDETDNDAPEHERALEGNTIKMKNDARVGLYQAWI